MLISLLHKSGVCETFTGSAVVCTAAPRRLTWGGGRHHGDLQLVILHHVFLKTAQKVAKKSSSMKFSRYNFQD